MWLLRLLLLGVFILIFFQDIKDRKVYWFLYPLLGILALILQLSSVGVNAAMTNIAFNLGLVSILLLVCFLYSKYKLDNTSLTDVLGLGDILFFIFITFSFSMIAFFVLFVFSLVFSLLMHLLLKNNQKEATVPLAGYMSLFFCVSYIVGFSMDCNYLYSY